MLPTTLQGLLICLVLLLLAAGIVVAAVSVLGWWRAHQAAITAWYVAHTTAQERAILAALAHDAVLFVERFASSPQGAAKLQQAVKYVQDALAARGLVIDVAEIVGALQAAYATLAQSGVLAAAGPTIGPSALPAPAPAPAPAPTVAAK